MGTLVKVAIVVVVVTVLFMTSAESERRSNSRRKKSNQVTEKDNTKPSVPTEGPEHGKESDEKRSDKGTRRNKAKPKEWLKDATDILQFRAVENRTKNLRDVLNSHNVHIANTTSFLWIQTCEGLFSKFKFRTKNYQKGQGDLLDRMRLFTDLLVKAAGCLEEEQGDDETVEAAKKLTESLTSYVKNVTCMCTKKRGPSGKEPKQCKRTRNLTFCEGTNSSCPGFFNPGEKDVHRNQSTYNEQLQFISTKLQEFLESLQSDSDAGKQGTSDRPRKGYKRKKKINKQGKGKKNEKGIKGKKGKKVPTNKKLKKIFRNMNRHRDLTSWKRRCRDDSIQLILTSKRSTDPNVTGPFEQYCPAPKHGG